MNAKNQKPDISHRKKHGQFFTPDNVAEFMVKFGVNEDTNTVLDPTCGLGIFIKKALEINDKINITGIDIDPTIIKVCQSEIKTKHPTANVSFHNQNYITEYDYSQKVDFLVCNPPYLNFHNFDRKIVDFVKKESGIKFNKLVNIYALFMVMSKKSVRKGGKIAFITPSDFFYTGYGKILKRFLLDNFTINELITFHFENALFDDALTTATITFLTNEKPAKDHKTKFTFTNEFESQKNGTINFIKQSAINPNEKWQKYFLKRESGMFMEKLVPLKEIASVKRGIATGHNEFFLLSENDATKWNIEKEYLVPVLSSAKQVPSYEITNKMIEILRKNGQKIYLLYCFGKISNNVEKYVDYGESNGVNYKYACVRRTPWYTMEKRKPSPIICTVFSRKNMRFIHNKAECRNLATFHGIYPVFDDENMIKALLCYLNSSFCAKVQKYARRECGNGLHYFAQSDVLELPVLPVTKLNKNDIKKLADMFDCMKQGLNNDPTQFIQKLLLEV